MSLLPTGKARGLLPASRRGLVLTDKRAADPEVGPGGNRPAGWGGSELLGKKQRRDSGNWKVDRLEKCG